MSVVALKIPIIKTNLLFFQCNLKIYKYLKIFESYYLTNVKYISWGCLGFFHSRQSKSASPQNGMKFKKSKQTQTSVFVANNDQAGAFSVWTSYGLLFQWR